MILLANRDLIKIIVTTSDFFCWLFGIFCIVSMENFGEVLILFGSKPSTIKEGLKNGLKESFWVGARV